MIFPGTERLYFPGSSFPLFFREKLFPFFQSSGTLYDHHDFSSTMESGLTKLSSSFPRPLIDPIESIELWLSEMIRARQGAAEQALKCSMLHPFVLDWSSRQIPRSSIHLPRHYSITVVLPTSSPPPASSSTPSRQTKGRD